MSGTTIFFLQIVRPTFLKIVIRSPTDFKNKAEKGYAIVLFK